MIVTIETERLIIRPVVPDDAETIFRWASDPEVTKYMIYSPHPNVQSTRAWLEIMRMKIPMTLGSNPRKRGNSSAWAESCITKKRMSG